MKKILLIIFVYACWSLPAWAVDAQQAKQAIEAAKQAHKNAVAVQGGWVSTSKLLNNAVATAGKGDNKKALALANKAKREAELSYMQATREKKNWAEPEYLK